MIRCFLYPFFMCAIAFLVRMPVARCADFDGINGHWTGFIKIYDAQHHRYERFNIQLKILKRNNFIMASAFDHVLGTRSYAVTELYGSVMGDYLYLRAERFREKHASEVYDYVLTDYRLSLATLAQSTLQGSLFSFYEKRKNKVGGAKDSIFLKRKSSIVNSDSLFVYKISRMGYTRESYEDISKRIDEIFALKSPKIPIKTATKKTVPKVAIKTSVKTTRPSIKPTPKIPPKPLPAKPAVIPKKLSAPKPIKTTAPKTAMAANIKPRTHTPTPQKKHIPAPILVLENDSLQRVQLQHLLSQANAIKTQQRIYTLIPTRAVSLHDTLLSLSLNTKKDDAVWVAIACHDEPMVWREVSRGRSLQMRLNLNNEATKKTELVFFVYDTTSKTSAASSSNTKKKYNFILDIHTPKMDEKVHKKIKSIYSLHMNLSRGEAIHLPIEYVPH